jgi:hypothetical protein
MAYTENDNNLPESAIYQNIRTVLVTARQKVYSAVNTAMVEAYWEIGRQIMEAQENKRAEYGAGLLKYLSSRLTEEFGKGFTQTNLKYMRQFYEAFPISHTLCDQLSWSHYRLLMKIDDASRLELGKGFSFVARQKRITLDGDHFYIDLVFYNYILKCFVLIDLKTSKLTHQDIGQIDFYVRYFDDQIKLPEDNPTLGIILCTEKNESMVKYSVLSDKDSLFASKYMLYLPTEEELKKELERERLLIESQK